MHNRRVNRIRAGGLLALALLIANAFAGPSGGERAAAQDGTYLAPAEAAGVKFGKRTLRQGMRGKDVRALQLNLTRLKQPTTATGYFGNQTRKSVRRHERAWGWRIDGRVQRRDAKRIKGLLAKRRARKQAQARANAAYVFPVADPHNFGGGQSRFGAPRSGHAHQGHDVFAACGTRLYAAQGGNVKARGYQGGAGHYIVIDGLDGTDTVYMHLLKASWATTGTLLYPGQQIGKVGQSGNASGCHLHFEHWAAPGWYTGGFPYDPLPELLYWDSYS